MDFKKKIFSGAYLIEKPIWRLKILYNVNTSYFMWEKGWKGKMKVWKLEKIEILRIEIDYGKKITSLTVKRA